MADFLTRLAEKAMGVLQVVQPFHTPMFAQSKPVVHIPPPLSTLDSKAENKIEPELSLEPSTSLLSENQQPEAAMQRRSILPEKPEYPENTGHTSPAPENSISKSLPANETFEQGSAYPPVFEENKVEQDVSWPNKKNEHTAIISSSKIANKEILKKDENVVNKISLELYDSISQKQVDLSGLPENIKNSPEAMPENIIDPPLHVPVLDGIGSTAHPKAPYKRTIRPERSTQPEKMGPVQVTIGRIEVRAIIPPSQAVPQQMPKPQVTSLEDYLRMRNRGRI